MTSEESKKLAKQAWKLHKKGLTNSEIAKKFKVAPSTVSGWFKRLNNGVSITGRQSKKAESTTDKIRKYLAKNPNAVFSQFKKDTGLTLSSTLFNSTKRSLKKKNGVKPIKKRHVAKKNYKALEEENAYLRWRLDGETLGYTDRLLDELGK